MGYSILVNLDLAGQLAATNTTRRQLGTWQRGGEEARDLSPLGYIGDPAAYDLERIRGLEAWFVETLAATIAANLD